MKKRNPKSLDYYKEFFIGKKFGRLTVLRYGKKHNGTHLWECVCECGKKCARRTEAFKRIPSRLSCGCLIGEIAVATHTKHGLHKSPEYGAYHRMKGRCLRSSDKEFFRYGGRGIKICQRWLDSFESFFADMGPRPAETSLDRIDCNGDYSPENCRWATALVQSNNTRRNRWVIVNGLNDTMAGHCRRYGLNKNQILHRVRHGFTYEDAFMEVLKGKTAA